MNENVYMQQVVQQKEAVERDLRMKRRPAKKMGAMAGFSPSPEALAGGESPSLPDVEFEAPAVDVRITGLWRFKNVIVPPNAYVIHTRRDVDKPLHIGLGISFKYNPLKDSFLVVPATMQTIIISANCICRERQGILVQGYVQWIIEDF